MEVVATDEKVTTVSVPPSAPVNRSVVRQGQPRTPPLESGDHLTRSEFERRYNAHPEIKKAELIEGVVYVASPVKVRQHGVPHASISTWFGTYCAFTPSIWITDNSTYRLDNDNEPQPDLTIWIDASKGGRATISSDDYLEGVPELVVEVSGSSATLDLRQKLRAYRRIGIQEYLVLLIHEQELRWFTWQEGEYIQMPPDEKGILRSQVFPGLWLDAQRFWAGDLAGVLAVLQTGLDSAEHRAFVARLALAPVK
jgi:Uma2 family endonuclease